MAASDPSPPTITSNAYLVPEAHRTPKILGCMTGRVYDGTWRKDPDRRRRRTTTGLGCVFGVAIRVKVTSGRGTSVLDKLLRS